MRTAEKWIEVHRRGSVWVDAALLCLRSLLAGSGRAELANNIRWRGAAEKARIAFARLRDALVEPERVLATQIGVAACIEDDGYAPKDQEYLQVQTAKALHRLASGNKDYHRGRRYPRSAGVVLRHMGRALDAACGVLVDRAVPAVITNKVERFGPHESKLPGYRPPWEAKRQAHLG